VLQTRGAFGLNASDSVFIIIAASLLELELTGLKVALGIIRCQVCPPNSSSMIYKNPSYS
jgi:hypothetical protein